MLVAQPGPTWPPVGTMPPAYRYDRKRPSLATPHDLALLAQAHCQLRPRRASGPCRFTHWTSGLPAPMQPQFLAGNQSEVSDIAAAKQAMTHTTPAHHRRCSSHGVAPHPAPSVAPLTPAVDLTSPRVLRHMSALNSPGKKHWTAAERLCCEVRATEEDYVSDLRRLLAHFFAPLSAFCSSNGIRLGALGELHHAAQFLLGVHEDLLAQLSTAEGNQSDENTSNQATEDTESDASALRGLSHPPVSVQQLTAAFSSTAEYLKCYALYCASHRAATEELDALDRKLPRTQHILSTLRDAYPEFPSDLIKPVQRICRYPLLFRLLAAKTAGTPESVEVVDVLQALERVSDLVNARVRDAELNERLEALHEMIDKPAAAARLRLLRPARTLVAEAVAGVDVPHRPHWRRLLQAFGIGKADDNHHRNHERARLVLLSDALLMAKKREHKLRLRRQLCLSCAAVKEDGDGDDSALVLVAAKVGRCRCHQLTPATLKRSPHRRSSLSLGGLSSDPRSTSSSLIDCSQSSPPTEQPQRGRHKTPLLSRTDSPFRATRRYVLHFETAADRSAFAAQLGATIVKCERVEQPSRRSSLRRTTGAAAKLPERLWRSVTQSQLAVPLGGSLGRRVSRSTTALAPTRVKDRTSRSVQ